MGGKSTSRGIYCQALAAVIKSFNDSNWDEITLEFQTKGDKVDIALFSGDKKYKAIQVKSSINSFQKSNVIKWINELCEDVVSSDLNVKQCVVSLIGPITGGVSDVFKILNKRKLPHFSYSDEELEILKGIDLKGYSEIDILVENPASSVNAAVSIAKNEMHKFLSDKGVVLNHEQVKIMTSAISERLLYYSTDGRKTSRVDLHNMLNSWILELKDEKTGESKIVSARTFFRATENVEKESNEQICLLYMFEGRKLKSPYSWNNSVYPELIARTKFMFNNSAKVQYALHMNIHISVAFALGRILDSKSGVHSQPYQRTFDQGTVKWGLSQSLLEYENWQKQIEQNTKSDEAELDVLILGITQDISKDVKKYLHEKEGNIGKVINCTLSENGANAVVDGNHANFLANEIYKVILEERSDKPLHIFICGPATFSYYLGRYSRGFGPIVLYEYNLGGSIEETYTPSFTFPNEHD